MISDGMGWGMWDGVVCGMGDAMRWGGIVCGVVWDGMFDANTAVCVCMYVRMWCACECVLCVAT